MEEAGMRVCRKSWVAGMVLGAMSVGAAGAVSGCSSSASSSPGSSVGSAVSSAISQGASAAGSAASQAASAAASALGDIKNGVDATSDAKVGAVTVGSDGHATTQVTVTNPTDKQHDYTVAVSFDDQNGALQDAVVVSVSGVAGKATATATARSNRQLSGTLTAKVTAAIQH
jgi:hypothetical protein